MKVLSSILEVNEIKHDYVNITSNSDSIKDGDVFLCLKGSKFDGHDFAEKILHIYPNCIVVGFDHQKLLKNKSDRVFCINGTKEQVVTDIIKHKYNKKPIVFAVTGTNGKTSTVHFANEIAKSVGIKSFSIGTIGVIANDKASLPPSIQEVDLTTPDVITLHRTLHIMKSFGYDFCFMEASSIAIQTGRINEIEIKYAGFTNLTQDHLDYHKTMEEYLRAKIMLFSTYLNKDGVAFLNADTPEYEIIKNQCISLGKKCLGYGKNGNFIKLQSVKKDSNEFFEMRLTYNEVNYNIKTKFSAEFQIYNFLQAACLFLSLGYNPSFVLNCAQAITSPKGRLELVELKDKNIKVYIDYAHTPDALEKAIMALKSNNLESYITVVFGCGGERDVTKRIKMGNIASKLANFVIVTDDNPRNEDAKTIRQQIIQGFAEVFKSYKEIPDRASAIEYAIKNTKNNSIILLAGKGHETYQIIGNTKHHFSDLETVLELTKI